MKAYRIDLGYYRFLFVTESEYIFWFYDPPAFFFIDILTRKPTEEEIQQFSAKEYTFTKKTWDFDFMSFEEYNKNKIDSESLCAIIEIFKEYEQERLTEISIYQLLTHSNPLFRQKIKELLKMS